MERGVTNQILVWVFLIFLFVVFVLLIITLGKDLPSLIKDLVNAGANIL